MAVNAYTGLMGSGKSFEVVSSVIVPAVKAGRRVVTNIDGIDPDAILAYCALKHKADASTLGSVVRVSNGDVLRDGFFPEDGGDAAASLVQPGDMVAIDEAWTFWSNSDRIKPEHQRFFRLHRHYVHATTGVACDLVLMIQSITDLHRQLRAVVELTFRTKKLKEVGASKVYRVEMYETNKITKALLLDTFIKKYDKDIFPFYHSYANGTGKEAQIDSRQNIFMNKRLWLMALFLLFIWAIASRMIWRFFYPAKVAAPVVATKPAGQVSHIAGTSPANTEMPVHPRSNEWRVVGQLSGAEFRHVVLASDDGRLRIEPAKSFAGRGLALSGDVDGAKVATWSGTFKNRATATHP